MDSARQRTGAPPHRSLYLGPLAGPGKDIVRAARGGRDRIDCGPGKDKAIIDKRRDRARHCEKVRKR